jgi:hemerythrin-like domain-containing protein
MDTPTGAHQRLAAFGRDLIEVHRWLREELARLRADTATYLDGHGERPQSLKAHCLSFCSALTRHHTSEDNSAFPVLASAFPELSPVIVQLEDDHRMVRAILDDLEQLLTAITAEPDAAEAAWVRGELDGLTAILESHFAFEERRIAQALNTLTFEAGTTESLLGFPAGGSC